MRLMFNGLRGRGDFKNFFSTPVFTSSCTIEDTKWIDGLRGIAACLVVAEHLTESFHLEFIPACCNDAGYPRFAQLPFVRLLFTGGNSWVAVFFILSGLVNALKPLKLARAGHTDAALANLSVSAFRRSFRLMLPATVATVISFLACELGAYEQARLGSAWWINVRSPARSDSFRSALQELLLALKATWTLQTDNRYSQPQWALIYLLFGSMIVFCALLITVHMNSKWRITTLMVFMLWSMDWSKKGGDPYVGLTVLGGVILAELQISGPGNRDIGVSTMLWLPSFILGLFLMSFPGNNPDMATWSKYLNYYGRLIFNLKPTAQLEREWLSVGGLLMILGVLHSPHLRYFLSRKPFVWLGKISFPVYLLHAIFLCSIMPWILYAGAPAILQHEYAKVKSESELLQLPGLFHCFIAVVVTLACLLVAAHYWTERLEPKFAFITEGIKDAMFTENQSALVDGSIHPLLPSHSAERTKAT